MSKVSVLLVVDVEGALSSNNLQDNIYLIDSNKYIGSSGEGGSNLATTLNAGSKIVWSVVPVQPDGQVSIAGFSGQAISENVINPKPEDDDNESWVAHFNTNARQGTEFQYTATLQFEGKQLTFDPYLKVK